MTVIMPSTLNTYGAITAAMTSVIVPTPQLWRRLSDHLFYKTYILSYKYHHSQLKLMKQQEINLQYRLHERKEMASIPLIQPKYFERRMFNTDFV